MRNEQALTTEKVIHQSSKLKPNKIKLDADERLGLRSLKEKNEQILSCLPYLRYILEGMATHSAKLT